MLLWPPDWIFFFSIVAFLAPSIAVHGWRDLAMLVVISSPLVFPVKWIGPVLGFPQFAADALTYGDADGGGWTLHFAASPALLAAIILGSLLMIAGKEIVARRNENSA
jgi:hypothetical protein